MLSHIRVKERCRIERRRQGARLIENHLQLIGRTSAAEEREMFGDGDLRRRIAKRESPLLDLSNIRRCKQRLRQHAFVGSAALLFVAVVITAENQWSE